MWSTLCHLSHWSANMPSQYPHVIYHVISGRAVETIAEPIDCHLSRAHGIKQKSCRSRSVWGLERVVLFMCTQYTIWGAVPILCATCQLVGRLTESDNKRHHIMFQSTHHNLHQFYSMMHWMSSISCSRAVSISIMSIVINPEHMSNSCWESRSILLCVLDTNAHDLPCVW